MRQKVERFLRASLLVLSLVAIGGPAAGGVLMLLISMMFCDSGPFQRCVHMGLMFVIGAGVCAALPLPVVVALLRDKSEMGWYMYGYPFLILGLAWVAYAKGVVALGLAGIAFGYVALALVAFAYLLLHHTNAKMGRR